MNKTNKRIQLETKVRNKRNKSLIKSLKIKFTLKFAIFISMNNQNDYSPKKN